MVAKTLNKNLPTISVIMPTYNAARTLHQCLSSILSQDYPREKLEVIIVDGGSSDGTINIVKKFGADKVLKNPLRVEEAGKPFAIDIAKNEIIAFIDSDNVLPSTNWIRRMVEPFDDTEVVGSEPLYYEHRARAGKRDGLITRYCSLIGGDDALHPYLGDYDRFCHFRGKWTEISLLAVEDKGSYLKVKLGKEEIPTMGANGFFVKKEVIRKVKYKPLQIHTDTIYQLVKSGYNCIAKVKVGIVHLHSDDISVFVKKKLRRIQKYFLWKKYIEYYPMLSQLRLLKFVLSTVLFIPLAMDIGRGYRKIQDCAWFFHFLACFLTLLTYGMGILFIVHSFDD